MSVCLLVLLLVRFYLCPPVYSSFCWSVSTFVRLSTRPSVSPFLPLSVCLLVLLLVRLYLCPSVYSSFCWSVSTFVRLSTRPSVSPSLPLSVCLLVLLLVRLYLLFSLLVLWLDVSIMSCSSDSHTSGSESLIPLRSLVFIARLSFCFSSPELDSSQG